MVEDDDGCGPETQPLDEPLVIPPGAQRVTFQSTGLSFVSSDQVRVRYRLDDYDRDWVDAGDRRLAFYTNLKPGRYRFQVIAANADGVWNQTGDSLEIVLHAHFY